MPKFYVADNNGNRLIIDRPNSFRAAKAFAYYWLKRKNKLGTIIGMNEEGFDVNKVDTDNVFRTLDIIANIE